MIRKFLIAWFLASLMAAARESPDLIRFTNGDQLHGAFLGIKAGPQALWKRNDVAAPVEFKTSGIRNIVLNGGRPRKAQETLSHLGLVNGDRIPGVVTAIDAESVTIDSSCAGTLKIPRKQVAMLAPNPMGGRLCFYGPFNEDGWRMIHAAYPDGLPDVKPEDAAEENEDDPGRWEFSGAAWYWREKKSGTALIRGEGMPDRAVLRFEIAWKNRLSLAVGFHADFLHVKTKEDEEEREVRAKVRAFLPGDASDLPRVFGNSYVLQMYSNYLMLYRTAVDADGKTTLQRVQLNSNNLRLGESGQAAVEIRSNRRNGGISLFVDDEFVAQWSEVDPSDHGEGRGFAGKGSGFGFIVQGDDTPVRISDVIVSEWNGLPDSARSLQVDDQDVVLMTNGTDRYAGSVTAMENDGKIVFEGRHGRFRFPLEEVAEIRFARDHLASPGELPADGVVVRLNPIGIFSGRPVAGDGSSIGIVHPILGEATLSLDSAVMLDFNASNQFIDDWDADF